jgi:acyl-CoA synthetase (AMP-forming)/AMP-acid ligase II
MSVKARTSGRAVKRIETSDLATIFSFDSREPRREHMPNFILDNTSAKSPLNVALIFAGKTYTYVDLCRLTQGLGASLLERRINPGDRVAFPLPN